LTLRDLTFRATRFVVVIVMGAVVFALLFVMTGLVNQFNTEPYDTVHQMGADHWVVAAGISGPFTAASAIPVTAVGEIDAAVVVPVVTSRSSLATADDITEIILVGAEIGALGNPTVVDGRTVAADGEAVVDESLGVDVGSTVVIAGVDAQVVGTSRRTTLLAGVPAVFTSLHDAQLLTFGDDQLTSAVLTSGVAPTAPPGYTVMTSDAVALDVLGPIENAIASVDLVRALLWLVTALIIGSVVYLSALERQRDFAVLKAIGTSNKVLMGSLGLQAALVAILAAVLAIALQFALVPLFPMSVVVPTRAFWQVPVFAVAMALVAGAAGMRKVASSDPALAFAGAGG